MESVNKIIIESQIKTIGQISIQCLDKSYQEAGLIVEVSNGQVIGVGFEGGDSY